jgi:hypothetical protein
MTAACGGLDHDRAGGRLNLAGAVLVVAQEHADDLVDDSRLVGAWLDA